MPGAEAPVPERGGPTGPAAPPPARATEPLGPALSALLALRGRRLGEVAARMGVSHALLSRATHGHAPLTHARLEQLAAALDVEPAHFQEYRRLVVRERLDGDPALVDEIFDRPASQRPAPGS